MHLSVYTVFSNRKSWFNHSKTQGSIHVKRIGVDVGGTFTDLILVDEEAGKITVDKVPSTPDDPARGVVIEGITHRCAEVGMITTEGFRDRDEHGEATHAPIPSFGLRRSIPVG